MIYTVTCNPALDCAVTLDTFCEGTLNRTGGATLTPGGKGINVSRVLAALGEDTLALGFIAGENGALLQSALRALGLKTDFLCLERGQTRINVKLYGLRETELNAPGAPVLPAALCALERQLAGLELTPADTVCLCGSLAPGMPPDTYARLVERLAGCGVVRTVVDASAAALEAAVAARPWLVKPNREELAALAGRDLPTLADVTAAAERLLARGAATVLVSLGGEGALLCAADGRRLYQPTPAGRVQGTVGAGDSLVAGFVAAMSRGEDVAGALRLGVACGSATAFSAGLATGEESRALLERLPPLQELVE